MIRCQQCKTTELDDPVLRNGCGHIFCMECADEGDACPRCSAPYAGTTVLAQQFSEEDLTSSSDEDEDEESIGDEYEDDSFMVSDEAPMPKKSRLTWRQ